MRTLRDTVKIRRFRLHGSKRTSLNNTCNDQHTSRGRSPWRDCPPPCQRCLCPVGYKACFFADVRTCRWGRENLKYRSFFRGLASKTTVNTPKPYLDVARKLGNILADGGHMTVNGAGRVSVLVSARWLAWFRLSSLQTAVDQMSAHGNAE